MAKRRLRRECQRLRNNRADHYLRKYSTLSVFSWFFRDILPVFFKICRFFGRFCRFFSVNLPAIRCRFRPFCRLRIKTNVSDKSLESTHREPTPEPANADKKPTTNYTFPEVPFQATGGRRRGTGRDRAGAVNGQKNGQKEAFFRTKNGVFRSAWGLSRVCNLKTDVYNIII